MQQVKVKVEMTVKNMYDFLLRHSYCSVSGMIGVIFSISAIGVLIAKYPVLSNGQKILLIFGSLLFTVINPIAIYFSSVKQVKLNPTFRDELVYAIGDEGVTVQQNKQELLVTWSEVQKVVETRYNIIIYLTKVRAFVLPKENCKEQMVELKALIRQHVTGKACKLK